MKASELLRLVGLNINQNKFKSVMTSIGIVVGAATIVLVFGIGRGGQMDVAEQFAELNAGAIDVSYEYEGEEESSGGGFSFGNIGQMFGNMFSGMFGGGGPAAGGSAPGGGNAGGDASGSSSSDSGSGMPGGGFSGGGMPGGMPGSTGDSSSDSGDSTDTGGFPGGDFSGNMPQGGPGSDQNGNTDSGDSQDSGNTGENGNGQPGGENGAGPDGSGTDNETGGPGDAAADNGNTDSENGSAADAGNGETPDTGADSENAGSDTAESGSDTSESVSDSTSDSETADSEESLVADRVNQEKIILTEDDVDDIERYVSGISGATISYSTQASIEGAELTSAKTYSVAGVKESYGDVSKLKLADGDFITEADDDLKNRVCVLGATAAKEIFGSTEEIVGSTIYIADRTYTVAGVLKQTSTVSAGISPDTTIFIPYETGIKYVTGEDISPVITVIAENVNVLDSVIDDVKTVLEENYDNASFTFEDSGSKMEAAQSSNRTLTMLLSAMAAIVFLVGGIGIMNVLFVSVKERTNEIGILKAVGTPKADILIEFLVESAAISCMGGVIGVVLSFGVIPIVEHFNVRVEMTAGACLAALGFAVLTGTIFGIYPAWKASNLEPVEALNAE